MPPALVDTHCHYFSETTPDEARRLIERARSVGLTQALVCSARIGELAYAADGAIGEGLAFALGVHPFDAYIPVDEALHTLEDEVSRKKASPLFAAVGEIGLDFRKNVLADIAERAGITPDEAKARQIDLFVRQLSLARRLDLPVSVHAVHAAGALLTALESVPDVRGVIHAYNGSLETARRLAGLGFKLGFGGALARPNAQKLRDLLAALKATDWVLETDCPWMPAPDALSGEPRTRSEPADIVRILSAAAAARSLTPESAALEALGNTQQAIPALAPKILH